MNTRFLTGAAFVGGALLLVIGGGGSKQAAIAQGQRRSVPIFEVDPRFPRMPNGLVLGGVGGVTADSHGNVWAFHRPHTIEEGNAHEPILPTV